MPGPLRPSPLPVPAAALLALLAGACAVLPAEPADMPEAARPRDLPGLRNFAWVAEGRLARAARPDDATGYLEAARLGIRTVVDLRLTGDPAAAAAAAGLDLVEIPVEPWDADDDEIAAFLRVALDPGRAPVLVHCRHGADRTGMMVAAWRRCVEGWTAEQALAELPRFGFHRVHAALARRVRTLDPGALLRKAAAPGPLPGRSGVP